MTNAEIALNHFTSGRNCSQSVLAAFGKETGVDPDTALRIADGFGGGMGRNQNVCGAVTGGIMVLGLLFSKGETGTHAEKDELYVRVRRFMAAFEGEYGSVTCKTLLNGCNLMSAEGRAQFKESGLREKCADLIMGACSLLQEETSRPN